jgi:hypothetical protein
MTHTNESIHPYLEFEGTPEGVALDRAITELVDNNDLKETTARKYIIGYLCRAVASSRQTKV